MALEEISEMFTTYNLQKPPKQFMTEHLLDCS